MAATISHEDHQDVADLLVRYATGIDRRDWALFRTCFTGDCEVDYVGDVPDPVPTTDRGARPWSG